jgi:hypothetical protein
MDVTAASLSVSFGPHGGVPVKKYIQAAPTTTKTNRIINALRMRSNDQSSGTAGDGDAGAQKKETK